MLGMAFFKSLVKEHGKAYFEPLGKAAQANGIKNFNPLNPSHLWKLRGEVAAYGKWSLGRKFLGADRGTVPGLNPKLAEHLQFAQDLCQTHAVDLSNAMKKHQLKLADRQCRIAELSQRVQDTIVMIVTLMWAHGQKRDLAIASADILCQDLRRKLTGERPADKYFRDVGELADMIIAGGWEELAGVPAEEIMMRY
jgi:hypothetical protein